jgi:hypothetical protein
MKQRAQGPPSSFDCGGEEPSMGLLLFFNILSIFPYLNGIPIFGEGIFGDRFGGLSKRMDGANLSSQDFQSNIPKSYI